MPQSRSIGQRGRQLLRRPFHRYHDIFRIHQLLRRPFHRVACESERGLGSPAYSAAVAG